MARVTSINREIKQLQRQRLHSLPPKLELMPESELPNRPDSRPYQVWASRSFVVQVYQEDRPEFPGLLRLSINRTKHNGISWQAEIAWEELQQIKRECGFGDWYGVEVFPPDREVVNVSNMRHLWLLPKPLSIMFP